MADFLDEKRKEIQARLKELKPAVEEYQLLQAAEEALGGLSNGTTKPATRPRGHVGAGAPHHASRLRRDRRPPRPPARRRHPLRAGAATRA